MTLLILILNKEECLEELLEELGKGGVKGATILESTGMARALQDTEVLSFFGSLRMILDPDRLTNHTILIASNDEMVEPTKEIINRVLGGLDKPDTGILLGVPLSFAEGVQL